MTIENHSLNEDEQAAKFEKAPAQDEAPRKKGPGEYLRQARIAAELTVEAVAKQLYLPPSMIENIENNKFNESTGLIFMRGYCRSYARLVNAPIQEVMDAFDGLGLVEKPAGISTHMMYKKPNMLSERFVSWTTRLVILILVILVFMWWRTQFFQFPANLNGEAKSKHTVENVVEPPKMQESSTTETRKIPLYSPTSEANQVSQPFNPSSTSKGQPPYQNRPSPINNNQSLIQVPSNTLPPTTRSVVKPDNNPGNPAQSTSQDNSMANVPVQNSAAEPLPMAGPPRRLETNQVPPNQRYQQYQQSPYSHTEDGSPQIQEQPQMEQSQMDQPQMEEPQMDQPQNFRRKPGYKSKRRIIIQRPFS